MPVKTPENALKVSSAFLIEAIERNDPQLVNFLDLVFTLIDGAISDDSTKKMGLKQVQSVLFKLPILAMRSPIILGLYSKFDQQITGTIFFPAPDTVVGESGESLELPDSLIPADYQSGADDNGDLPSCEMDHDDDSTPNTVESEPEYGDEDIDLDKPKATKVKK